MSAILDNYDLVLTQLAKSKPKVHTHTHMHTKTTTLNKLNTRDIKGEDAAKIYNNLNIPKWGRETRK